MTGSECMQGDIANGLQLGNDGRWRPLSTGRTGSNQPNSGKAPTRQFTGVHSLFPDTYMPVTCTHMTDPTHVPNIFGSLAWRGPLKPHMGRHTWAVTPGLHHNVIPWSTAYGCVPVITQNRSQALFSKRLYIRLNDGREFRAYAPPE